MWILITILTLLSLIVVVQGRRIDEIEKENDEFDLFIDDITDLLNQLMKEKEK